MVTRQNDTIHVCFGITSITSVWSYETAIVTTVINIISSVFATVSNSIILVVLVGNKRLRSPPYLLLGGLCFSDLLVGLVIQPMAVMQRLNEINKRANCDFTLAFRYFQWLANSVSMFLIDLVTIDRYYAIRYPFRYADFATSQRYTLFMTLVWLLCASLLLVPYIWRSLQLFNLMFILIVIFVTVMLSLFCYSKIYRVILEQGRKITQTTLERENDDSNAERQDTRISNQATDRNLTEADDTDGALRKLRRRGRLSGSTIQWLDNDHIIQEDSGKESETSSEHGTRSIGKSNLLQADKKFEGGDSRYCKQLGSYEKSDIGYSIEPNTASLEAVGKRSGHENHNLHHADKQVEGEDSDYCKLYDSQGKYDINQSVQKVRARQEAIGKRRSRIENIYVREPTQHMKQDLNKNDNKEMTGDQVPSIDYLTVQGNGEQQGYKDFCGKQDTKAIRATHVHTSSLKTSSAGITKRQSMVCLLEVTDEQGDGPDGDTLAVNTHGERMIISSYPSKYDDGILLAEPKVGSQSGISSSRVVLNSNDCQVQTTGDIQATVESVQSRRPFSRAISFGSINSRLVKRLKKFSSTKRETKKTYTVILLFLIIFLSFMPLFIISLAVGRYSRYTYSAFTWGETVAFLSSSVNPVIYCFRMKDIRDAVKDLIRRCFKCSICLAKRVEGVTSIKVTG